MVQENTNICSKCVFGHLRCANRSPCVFFFESKSIFPFSSAGLGPSHAVLLANEEEHEPVTSCDAATVYYSHGKVGLKCLFRRHLIVRIGSERWGCDKGVEIR